MTDPEQLAAFVARQEQQIRADVAALAPARAAGMLTRTLVDLAGVADELERDGRPDVARAIRELIGRLCDEQEER